MSNPTDNKPKTNMADNQKLREKAIRQLNILANNPWDGIAITPAVHAYILSLLQQQEEPSAGISRAFLVEVLAYNNGNGKYNFSHLNSQERDNESFDAWMDLRSRIENYLIKLPAEKVEQRKEGDGKLIKELTGLSNACLYGHALNQPEIKTTVDKAIAALSPNQWLTVPKLRKQFESEYGHKAVDGWDYVFYSQWLEGKLCSHSPLPEPPMAREDYSAEDFYLLFKKVRDELTNRGENGYNLSEAIMKTFGRYLTLSPTPKSQVEDEGIDLNKLEKKLDAAIERDFHTPPKSQGSEDGIDVLVGRLFDKGVIESDEFGIVENIILEWLRESNGILRPSSTQPDKAVTEEMIEEGIDTMGEYNEGMKIGFRAGVKWLLSKEEQGGGNV